LIFKQSIIVTIFLLGLLSYFYLDKSIAYFFYENITGDLKEYIKLFSKSGEAIYPIIILVFIFLISYKRYRFYEKLSLFLLSSIALSGIITDIIKFVVARYRPPMLFDKNLYGFKGFDIGFLVNSFPSGHSATAFSVGVGLMLIFPKYKYLFLLFAFLVAFSRILLSVHFLSDVLIGSLIGGLTSIYLYNKFIEKGYFERKL